MNQNRVIRCLVIAILAFLLIVIVLFCASRFFYNKAIARNDKGFIQEEIQTSEEKNEEIPNEDRDAGSYRESRQWLSEINSEEPGIVSFDGIDLSARIIDYPVESSTVVILAHGYSSRGDHMAGFARKYYEDYGYNILLPDARGHGQSGGDYIDFGWYTRLDYLDWIDFLIDRYGEEINIILHGVSMGGATVLMTGGEELPPQVKGIISDCAYTSAYDVLAHQLKQIYRLPERPLIPLTSLYTEKKIGFSFQDASALEQVKKIKVPVFFIHGDADDFVPFSMLKTLYDACFSEKEMFIVPNAGHGVASEVDPDGYWSRVHSFIESIL